MYTMPIQVLAKFQLKITTIGDNIAQKQIFPKTWVIFGPYFSKIVNFMRYTMEMQVVTEY